MVIKKPLAYNKTIMSKSGISMTDLIFKGMSIDSDEWKNQVGYTPPSDFTYDLLYLTGDGTSDIKLFADVQSFTYLNIETGATVEVSSYNHTTGWIPSNALKFKYIVATDSESNEWIYPCEEKSGTTLYCTSGENHATITSADITTFRAGRGIPHSTATWANRGQWCYIQVYGFTEDTVYIPAKDGSTDSAGNTLEYKGQIKLKPEFTASASLTGNGTDNYLDTEQTVVDSENWYWEVYGKFNAIDGLFINGGQNDATDKRFYFGTNANKWSLGYKNSSGTVGGTVNADTNCHIFKIYGNGKMYVDDVLVNDKSSASGTQLDISLFLFGNNYLGSLLQNAYFTCLYSKIVNNNTTLQYLVPSGDGMWDIVNGTYHSLQGTISGNQTTQDEFHYNITNGFDLWQNDSDSTYMRVPFYNGNSTKTEGDTITGYTWVSRNPSVQGHNNAETKLKYPNSPLVWIADNEEEIFVDISGEDTKEVEFANLPTNTNNNLFGKKTTTAYTRHLMYGQALTGSALARAVRYVGQPSNYSFLRTIDSGIASKWTPFQCTVAQDNGVKVTPTGADVTATIYKACTVTDSDFPIQFKLDCEGIKELEFTFKFYDSTFGKSYRAGALGLQVEGTNCFRFVKDDFTADGGMTWNDVAYIAIVAIPATGETADFTLTEIVGGVADKTTVQFTFDDGTESHYITAYPMLADKGFKGTCHIVPTWIGDAGFMTTANLQTLYADGWDIANHGNTHLDPTGQTVSAIQTDIEDCTTWLVTNNMPRAKLHYAYPYGYVTDNTNTAVSNAGLLTARTILQGYNTRFGNKMYLYTLLLGKTSTLTSFTDALAQAQALDCSLNVVIHNIKETPTEDLNVATSVLQSIVNYCSTNSITVNTITSWYSEAKI